MAVIKAKPTSPGRRGVISIKSDLYKGRPHKALLEKKSKNGGRNNNGRITVRHQGGGHKQHYRVIDFKRDKLDVPAVVERIEYDPNRSAHLALLKYADGERRYIIAPSKIKVGDPVVSADQTEMKAGNCMKLVNIPLGTTIHCVEMKPGKGAQIARSAGTSARLVAKEGIYATLRLQSGEMRKILSACKATLGTVSNQEKILNLIKEKAKPNKKEISKDEAEKILKEAHKHDHDHEVAKKETKKSAKTKTVNEKKPLAKASKSKPKVKKVSKK